MAADDDDKTEEPTQRKLEEARRKGDIIYSTEVGSALSLLAAAIVIAFMAGPIVAALGRGLVVFLAAPQDFAFDTPALLGLTLDIVVRVGATLGLAALAFILAGIAARYIQDRPTFTGERLSPKLEKLNPVEGLKRVFGRAAFANFLKTLAKFTIVSAAVAAVLWPRDAALEQVAHLDPMAVLPFVQERAVALMITVAAAASLMAAIDYVFTRQSYMRKQRMSRREMKDEFRQNEGDPMVKLKLRQIRQERARQRMMANVPQASVVITNPTHYAVALRYEQGVTAAPICVAKGVDEVALRIRALAEEHDIPIHEDPPLARALFAAADVDEPIPRAHYEAVAKIIGIVMRIAQQRRRARIPPNRR